MTNAVEVYRDRQSALESSLMSAVSEIVSQVSGIDAGAGRDALLKIIPALVERYGAVAAELAVEYYAQAAAGDGVVGFVPVPVSTGEVISPEDVETAVRRLAGHLWEPADVAALDAGLQASVGRWVRNHGRQTIALNTGREGVRLARVAHPGACDFCMSMQTYWGVDGSRDDAEKLDKFHSNCACELVRAEIDGGK